MDEDNAGLRLLSLDGGGIRGMSELWILKDLMEKIKLQKSLDHEPLPCEYFDMIGGTGTGGLIALMLGRLCMPVSEAINHYKSFSEKVFSHGRKYFGDGKFKASVFEDAFKAIVQTKTHFADLRLCDNRWNQRGCHTFVCARSGNDMNAGTPVLFRTYPKDRSLDCTIWEAARATSAAPRFFKTIRIKERPYIEGGVGYNNPTDAVIQEARFVYANRKIACIISIGNSQPSAKIVKGSLLQRFSSMNTIRTLIVIAADCESTSESMAQRFQTSPNIYFRFNVPDNIRLQEWDRLGGIEMSEKMNVVVGRILEPQGGISLPVENL